MPDPQIGRLDVSPDDRPGEGLGVLVINSMLHGGGVDAHTLAQCQALLAVGMRVALVCSTGSRWLVHAQGIQGLEVIALRGRPWQWLARLAKRLRQGDLQLLHAHHGRDHWLSMAARWLARRPEMPLVVTRHLMTPLKPRTRRRLARHAHVVAVSQAVARSLLGQAGEPALHVICIPCGIDTERFTPDISAARRLATRSDLGLPADALLFALVGAIHAPDGKGQFHFAEAARAVLDRHPQAHFVCMGNGEAVPQLLAHSERLQLQGHFHLRAFSDDVVGLMQGLDVLVHPAVSTEALGLVLLEAQACGRPVIGSRLDGIPETLVEGDTGLLVPPRDVSALAAAMLALAEQPLLRDQMGAAGCAWVSGQFSLDRMARSMVALYRQLLARPPHRRG